MSTPRYWPVIQMGTGRVVGAELHASPLARVAAQAFAFGPAADEHWWLAVRLRPGQVAAPAAVDAVTDLVRDSGLPPDRLLLEVTEDELARAVGSGSASSIGALGVRFSVTGFSGGGPAGAALRSAPVAFVQVSLAGLDPADPADVALLRSAATLAAKLEIEVIGTDVESAAQLELAGTADIGLVQGYWWGSPGSLAKLLSTWGRRSVSG